MMSKVIAQRKKNVLPYIIHHNQTGYAKDRFIGETIQSIFDIMDFSVSENIPGLLLLIDFQKAFDSVEWSFLYESLKMFNFGENFLRWVKTFYNNIQSCSKLCYKFSTVFLSSGNSTHMHRSASGLGVQHDDGEFEFGYH